MKKVSEELALRSERRAALIEAIKEKQSDAKGVVLLIAGFERDREVFFQESSFDYFVGINEPALAFIQPLEGKNCLFEPAFSTDRSVWLPKKITPALLQATGIDALEASGEPNKGYSTTPFMSKNAVEKIIVRLQEVVQKKEHVFTPVASLNTVETKVFLDTLCQYVPGLDKQLVAIDAIVGQLRRKKSMRELEHIYRAIEITAAAQEAAAETIEPGINESEVHATINYIFTQGISVPAFTSIVGSGKNSTVLHYVDNNDVMHAGDLVVVDIGASYNHYAADVTRTYPVSGTYTKRQKEVYELVLECQMLVEEHAKPGMFLRNAEHPEKSLHHIAQEFFKKKGVADYFPHGIGHFVGLDVHDVGDVTKPLASGDIITIEPGLYFPEEKLGVRIEDMFWIVEDGSVCLTDGIIRDISEIEEVMAAARVDSGL